MSVERVQAVRFLSGDLTLEGLLHLPQRTPAPGIVVCHPHPLYGGDMTNGVVAGLCRALVEDGIAALRFNFRGVGASEGSYDSGRGERADAVAGVEWLRARPEIDGERIGLAGYSFGAIVACAAAASVGPLRALVLISPPMVGGELTIPEGVPVLVVVGDADAFAPLAAVRDALTGRPDARLKVIAGADHFWWEGSARLFEAARSFLKETLASPEPG